jgi:hypothetical protein
MRHRTRPRLAIAALAMLLATPALPQNAPDAGRLQTTPLAATPLPRAERPPEGPNPYADPPGVPACRQVCTPTACPAGQACAPFCYQECM